MLLILAIYLVLGAFAGVFAGLLGVGGGIILVPVLNVTLPMEGVPASLAHHMALATSMGSIVFTAASSARAHNKRGTVLWDIVKVMAPGVVLGTLSGTFVVSMIPSAPLKVVFTGFVFFMAIQMILDAKPKASRHLPAKRWMFLYAAAVGMFSSFVGIGGGVLIIPFLVMCNVPMINVIGVSAVLGFPLAIAGSLGFIWNGYGLPDLPPYSLGYIHLTALAGIVVASMLTAPLGVKLSHSLPSRTLKRFFGFVLVIIAARMLYSIL
jgi:Predicted permeases